MPVRISHLARDQRTIQVPVGDDAITVTYRPSAITPATEDAFRAQLDDQRGGAALVTFLADCLVEWDILDDDGKPLAPTAPNLRRIPIVVLGQIVAAIAQDLRPDPLRSGTSDAGS